MEELKLKETLISNIKEYRRVHGLKQSEFGDRVGASRAKVGSWEEGRAIPSLEFLIKLSALFSQDINSLLTVKM